jgi:hypothetical protein
MTDWKVRWLERIPWMLLLLGLLLVMLAVWNSSSSTEKEILKHQVQAANNQASILRSIEVAQRTQVDITSNIDITRKNQEKILEALIAEKHNLALNEKQIVLLQELTGALKKDQLGADAEILKRLKAIEEKLNTSPQRKGSW